MSGFSSFRPEKLSPKISVHEQQHQDQTIQLQKIQVSHFQQTQQQNQQQDALQEQKKRLESLSNLLNMLQHKSSQSDQFNEQNPNNKSNRSLSSRRSSIKTESEKQQQRNLQNAEISISQPFEQKSYPTNQKFYPISGSKPKSKFAKQQNSFEVEEPFIITSSHKSFFTPSKSTMNFNTHNNQPSIFLSPGNHANPSCKQLTSAGNIVEHLQNQHQSGQKTNRSALGQKSSTQVQKQTTFAALPSKRDHQPQNSNGISLYEEVLAKNFEVIDNLLRKLNQIYSHQEEYENTMTEISQKLHKLQVDNENIHHEFRTSHFMIDKKLNSITNEYSNMLQDMNLMKKMWNQNSGRSKPGYFVGSQGNNEEDDAQTNPNGQRRSAKRKSSTRNSRKSRRNSRLSIFGNDKNGNPLNNSSNTHNQSTRNSPRNSRQMQRRSTKKSMNMSRRSSNWQNLKGVDEQNLGKILLQQINESSGWQGSESSDSEDSIKDQSTERKDRSKHQDTDEHSQSMIHDQDEKSIRRSSKRTNSKISQKERKKSRFIKKNKRISIDKFEDISELKSYISHQFIKMSQNAEQLKKFTQLGIETMMTRKCQTLQEKIEEKFFEFRRQVIEEKIQKQFRKSILDQIQQQTIQLIQKDIDSLKNQILDRVNNLQRKVNKQIQRKCDKQQVRQDLKEILQSMNRKVNTLMDECYHKFAERAQTKRAVIFLEKKINKLVETAHKFSLDAPVETSDNVKCLSCNKNVPFNGNGHSHTHTQSQPMFTQVHIVPPAEKQLEYAKEFNMTARKNDSSLQKNKVKFKDITNLTYASVNQIFDHSNNLKPSEQQQGINRNSTLPVKPVNQTASSSKEAFIKKFNNSQTSESLHFGSNNHLKTKVILNTQDNRPTTSMNASIHDANQKNWKEKATSILKKQTNTGANWRSKSLYKKVS